MGWSARPVRTAVLPAATAGLLAALSLTGCGIAGSGAGRPAPQTGTVPEPSQGSLSVSPADPTPRSAIRFAFTAPVATGVHGTSQISYSLSVTGRAGSGCIGAHEAGSPSVGNGSRAVVTVGPAQLGRPWCTGSYNARMIELRSAHCTGSAPCPQYIDVVGIVARGTFTVRRS